MFCNPIEIIVNPSFSHLQWAILDPNKHSQIPHKGLYIAEVQIIVRWVGHHPVGGAEVLDLYSALLSSFEVFLDEQYGGFQDKNTVCKFEGRNHAYYLIGRELEQHIQAPKQYFFPLEPIANEL